MTNRALVEKYDNLTDNDIEAFNFSDVVRLSSFVPVKRSYQCAEFTITSASGLVSH